MTRFVVRHLTFLVLFSIQAAAEEAPSKRFIQLDIADAAIASASDPAAITILKNRLRFEQRTRTQVVTRHREEVRTRNVVSNGVPVPEVYTEKVPYKTEVEHTYLVGVPEPDDPITVPVARVVAWDASGERLADDLLLTRMSQPTAVMLLKAPWREGWSVEPAQLAVLRDDILFLYVAEIKLMRRIQAVRDVKSKEEP